MKKIVLLACLVWIVPLSFFNCKGNSLPEIEPERYVNQQKIVAYLPTWKIPYTVQWEKITHVCLAFGLVNPDGTVNVEEVRRTSGVIKQAHDNEVSVLLSIGGGGSQNFTSAILNESFRKVLVNQLVAVVKELQLDGLDVDYEEWDGGENGVGKQDLLRRSALENLYKELRAKLPDGKLITAAVNADWDDGGWGYYNCFNNTMHEYLDFVSLMIYDETGPWSGNRTGSHSSWYFFEKSVNHWLNNRKLSKEKLVTGVPFYGYKFQSRNSAANAESISYKDIIIRNKDVEAQLLDSIGLLYYDGMPTIQKKSQYVKDNGLGGVMFWEISQDSNDPTKSLLNVINQVFKQKQ